MDIEEIATKTDVAQMLAETERRILQALLGKAVNDECLNVDEAVKYIKAENSSTIYKLTHSGQLAYHKVGKRNVFRKSDLDRYLARHRKSSHEEIKAKAALRGI